MKILAAALLATGLMLSAATPTLAAKTSSVKVQNLSDWNINHMFLSPADEESWGPDWLGEDVLSKNDSMTLTDVPCGSYDIRVVDEDGDECIIAAVKLCNDVATWKITNKELLSCIEE